MPDAYERYQQWKQDATATPPARDAYHAYQEWKTSQRPAWGDVVAGLPITRLAMGAASPLIGAAQLGAKTGDWINEQTGTKPMVSPLITKKLQEYEAAKQRGMQAAGNEGYDWMGLLGNLVPSSRIASNVAQALPQLGKVGVGAAQGGVIGATSPVTSEDFGSSKTVQTVLGAAVGGAVPLIGAAGEAISNAVAPVADLFRKSGPANYLKRYHEQILGAENLRPIKQALRGATQRVRGSQPTAAEAVAGLPEGSPLQAAQQITAKAPGGPSMKFGERLGEQQAARRAMLEKIAPKWTEAESKAVREAASKPLYQKAFQDIIQPNRALRRLMDRPSMQGALMKARELAKEQGVRLPWSQDHVRIQELHYVKLALDDLVSSSKLPGGKGLGATEERAILGTKDELVKLMEAQSAAYAKARATYQRLSGIVNRVQVREALKDKLTNPTGTESPGVYLRAVDQAAQMLKKSTGFGRFTTIDQVLPPQEAKLAKAVAEDLERSVASTHPLQPTALQSGGDVAKQIMPHLPNMLSRPMMAMNFILSKVGHGDIEPKIHALATQQYLNPKQLASALSQTYPNLQTQRMLQALQQLAVTGGATVGAQEAR